MKHIETIEELDALYGSPSEAAIKKVTSYLTPCYREWIEKLTVLCHQFGRI
jgi:predicted pyridoxine 5'-phosphate oxidase superfamily flavin-nucleotide-binding protein